LQGTCALYKEDKAKLTAKPVISSSKSLRGGNWNQQVAMFPECGIFARWGIKEQRTHQRELLFSD
jgi:hypothetical protein